MKTIAIVNQECDIGAKGEIKFIYEGAPAPESYARASVMSHIELPQEMVGFEDCIDVTWDEADAPVLTLNAQKKAAKQQLQAVANAQRALDNAINFGQGMIKEITLENMMLGITQDGKTGEVRKALAEALSALQTGSLYDAIVELKAIPEIAKDAKYITDARLLSAVNKIEAYLGQPLSETL